jgi:hypothetical protein
MYAYVDETGNTGRNIFDPEQPLFITAALITKTNFDLLHKQDIKAIASKIGKSELHANEIGIEGIEKIAEELLKLFKKCDARFFISRVEKKYLVVTKFVDTLFDPFENKAVPLHVYNIRASRLFLTYKVAINLNEDIAKKFWLSLLEKKKPRAYEMLLETLCEFERDILKLTDEGLKRRISDAVQWVKQHPESIDIHSNSNAIRLGHLPNMVAFPSLLKGIDQRSKVWKRKVVEIVHDRQSQFQGVLRDCHDFHKNAPAGVKIWIGDEHSLRCVEGSNFRISSSANSAGIQTIDIVIWLLKHSLNGKPLGYNSVKLVNYIIKNAYESDFSFDALQNGLNEYFTKRSAKPVADDDLKKAEVFLNLEEEYRQKEMLEYTQEKFAKRTVD